MMASLVGRILSIFKKKHVCERAATDECCICWENLVQFKTLRPCLHQICAECMNQYLDRRQNKCPLCRQTFNLDEHAVPILSRRRSTRHAKESVRASLSRHDHSRHVQASVRMKSGIPPLQNVKMVEVRSGVIVCTTNRDLEWQLRQNKHFRILKPAKYIEFFRRQ